MLQKQSLSFTIKNVTNTIVEATGKSYSFDINCDFDLSFVLRRVSHKNCVNERRNTQLKNSSQWTLLILNRAHIASKEKNTSALLNEYIESRILSFNGLPLNKIIRVWSKPGLAYVGFGYNIESLSSSTVKIIFNSCRAYRPQSPVECNPKRFFPLYS